eukprot:TRINITY_DN2108_c0_g1_i4.p1 TRINITY_DN2108_c0_g1~~TRINITY_DN2108_c0_g1_i4.p1  ORF type:complete len:264 (+),score=23.65 TRINITY_DN2108_c0_g1_i4:312-1103(+)
MQQLLGKASSGMLQLAIEILLANNVDLGHFTSPCLRGALPLIIPETPHLSIRRAIHTVNAGLPKYPSTAESVHAALRSLSATVRCKKLDLLIHRTPHSSIARIHLQEALLKLEALLDEPFLVRSATAFRDGTLQKTQLRLDEGPIEFSGASPDLAAITTQFKRALDLQYPGDLLCHIIGDDTPRTIGATSPPPRALLSSPVGSPRLAVQRTTDPTSPILDPPSDLEDLGNAPGVVAILSCWFSSGQDAFLVKREGRCRTNHHQ